MCDKVLHSCNYCMLLKCVSRSKEQHSNMYVLRLRYRSWIMCALRRLNGNNFHLPSANLKLFQKEVFNSGIKTYNHLPMTIKELSHNVKQFRLALKRFIISNSFYFLEEYFDINWKWVMFCYTGYTVPCKMACWLLILKLFLYLICMKFHYCILLTLLIQISPNLYTYILYAAVLFFCCIIIKMTISISCKRSTENEWMNKLHRWNYATDFWFVFDRVFSVGNVIKSRPTRCNK
jgi:hypothetical protein